jgi:hypothetical protein
LLQVVEVVAELLVAEAVPEDIDQVQILLLLLEQM